MKHLTLTLVKSIFCNILYLSNITALPEIQIQILAKDLTGQKVVHSSVTCNDNLITL